MCAASQRLSPDIYGEGSKVATRGLILLRHVATMLSGCPMVSVLKVCHCIRLRAFLSFDYVELDLIAIFERFVPIQLDCRVVDEYIRPVFASDESEALGVIKPLNNSFVLCHKFPPSLPGIPALRVIHLNHHVGERALAPSPLFLRH